jgi:hypothetical protein
VHLRGVAAPHLAWAGRAPRHHRRLRRGAIPGAAGRCCVGHRPGGAAVRRAARGARCAMSPLIRVSLSWAAVCEVGRLVVHRVLLVARDEKGNWEPPGGTRGRTDQGLSEVGYTIARQPYSSERGESAGPQPRQQQNAVPIGSCPVARLAGAAPPATRPEPAAAAAAAAAAAWAPGRAGVTRAGPGCAVSQHSRWARLPGVRRAARPRGGQGGRIWGLAM